MKINLSKLEYAMATNELTIADIRRLSNTSSSTFARVKRGENIRPDIVGKIAKSLGVNVEDIAEMEANERNAM